MGAIFSLFLIGECQFFRSLVAIKLLLLSAEKVRTWACLGAAAVLFPLEVSVCCLEYSYNKWYVNL